MYLPVLLRVLLLGAGLASPMPGIDTQHIYPSRQLAKFDNVTAGLVGGVPVRGLTPLGPYQNLFYNAIGVIPDLSGPNAGVPAQSSPNVAAFDLVASLQGQQAITSDHRDSTTDHFDLISFYYGCVVSTQETIISAPQTCGIELTGYRKGSVVATASLTFNAPIGTVAKNLQQTNFSKKFYNIDRINFKVIGTATPLTTGVLIDNVDYVAYLSE